MISVYQDADYLAAYKQKQRLWWTFVGVTGVYLAFCIGWLVYHISLPYAHAMAKLPRWNVYGASALYAVFLFVFMGIKYGRARRYFKLLQDFSIGLKNEETNYFYTFEENALQKNNVDAFSCVFETWNKKKQEWLERVVYFDSEMPTPPLESGDFVRYIVQGNFVVQYEILQKKALEFEEIDESEDVESVEEA